MGHSCGSIRAFCRQHGLAVSSFGLWHKRLNHKLQSPVASPRTLTSDTVLIAAATVAVPNALPASDRTPSRLCDQVIVILNYYRNALIYSLIFIYL
ncbi:IS66 family insertion sequence element accessory protein TnpA [Cupriavidus basilensis]